MHATNAEQSQELSQVRAIHVLGHDSPTLGYKTTNLIIFNNIWAATLALVLTLT